MVFGNHMRRVVSSWPCEKVVTNFMITRHERIASFVDYMQTRRHNSRSVATRADCVQRYLVSRMILYAWRIHYCFPPNLEKLTQLFLFNLELWAKLVTKLQNRLINSRDGYASNEANVLLWEGENEGRYTYHSGVWVTSNFWQLRSLRTERRSTSTKCNGTMRWMKKISRLIVLSTRRVYDTVVKYSWQLDAETCKWPSYLWFFYIVIEYTNKVKVACTKLVDWNIFASFIRVFF